MPKVKREPLPTHVIVPDTNILWDKDKKSSVSPDFDAFWAKSQLLIPLRLVVPEVVLGELQFQQATSANKLASNVEEQIKELSGIAQASYSIHLDGEKIKKQVGNKLKKWLTSLNGIEAKTPVSGIDWSAMVQSAVWRTEPFTYDPKDKDNEKGFRDALILETLIDICNSNASTANTIVFICNDYLLRTTAEKRLKHNSKALVFESLVDFDAYIKLTQEKLTDKFVKAIQSHARLKFYLADDTSCIYYRENIRQAIKKKFADLFALPPHAQGPKFGIGTQTWGVSDEKWWINATRFDRLVAPREYHWISQVTASRLLTSSGAGGFLSSLIPREEQVQIDVFDIHWKANVKADGRFHNIEVLGITPSNSSKEIPNDELLARWKLQRTEKPIGSQS
jgi:hypothetical protein